MSFPVKLFQFLSICNSRSSGGLVRQSSRGVESPAKFLLCCASPRFVCLVCGRGVRVKCFLQVSSQIHGRQQSQCLGFAWPFPKGGVPLDVTFLCPTGELQQQCPFSSSCPSPHSWSSSERYLEIDTWVTCWAHQVASVFQQEVLIFANSLVPGRACVYPGRALLNSSVQFLFVSRPMNQNKPIYAVSSREQDLLPVLVICTNCSPEILIPTGSSPVEPGTQGDTQLSLLHLSHLNVFWLDLCFACLENFSSEHQMNPSVLLSTLHHVKIP